MLAETIEAREKVKELKEKLENLAGRGGSRRR